LHRSMPHERTGKQHQEKTDQGAGNQDQVSWSRSLPKTEKNQHKPGSLHDEPADFLFMGKCHAAPSPCALSATVNNSADGRDDPLESAHLRWSSGTRGLDASFGLPQHAAVAQPLPDQLLSARKQFGFGNPAGIDIAQDRTPRFIFLVLDSGLALQHSPGVAALDTAQHQLAGDRPILGVSVGLLHLDVYAKVGHIGAMLWN